LTALSLAREHGNEKLHELMRAQGMSTAPTSGPNACSRLEASELGRLLAADSLGLRRRGRSPGGSTKKAFESLAEIASKDDGAINRAIGAGLVESGLIESYEAEIDLGTELVFASDLRLHRNEEPIRLEVMWRSKTSRAGIANYVLVKLRNYGRAIGYLA
jgi:DNA (cytosine-5)-methyltransferase 1